MNWILSRERRDIKFHDQSTFWFVRSPNPTISGRYFPHPLGPTRRLLGRKLCCGKRGIAGSATCDADSPCIALCNDCSLDGRHSPARSVAAKVTSGIILGEHRDCSYSLRFALAECSFHICLPINDRPLNCGGMCRGRVCARWPAPTNGRYMETNTNGVVFCRFHSVCNRVCRIVSSLTHPSSVASSSADSYIRIEVGSRRSSERSPIQVWLAVNRLVKARICEGLRVFVSARGDAPSSRFGVKPGSVGAQFYPSGCGSKLIE